MFLVAVQSEYRSLPVLSSCAHNLTTFSVHLWNDPAPDAAAPQVRHRPLLGNSGITQVQMNESTSHCLKTGKTELVRVLVNFYMFDHVFDIYVVS